MPDLKTRRLNCTLRDNWELHYPVYLKMIKTTCLIRQIEMTAAPKRRTKYLRRNVERKVTDRLLRHAKVPWCSKELSQMRLVKTVSENFEYLSTIFRKENGKENIGAKK